ncbi:MAG TPA: LuxR C-terminal-related transcriptional regulator [Thermomicrobiales bacterium]|nr:LuxR C-terminal-related transcriptional regulator [Thermomicrobiales bacterium]
MPCDRRRAQGCGYTPGNTLAHHVLGAIMSIDHATIKRLPRPQSSLVGRTAETAEILALLARPDVRLVTLTGPGGVGKTRLALHAALTAPGFVDGRWFIELAGITEPSLILPRIAQALELRERSEDALRDQLVQALDGRDVLLVIDNFEHLLDGAVILSQVLGQVTGPNVLTTSRAPLNLAREYLVQIGPLDLAGSTDGAETSEAARLFLQRSEAIRPGYEPSPADLRAIEAICAELSGIPLALELAAARTRIMAPQALLARLSQPLRLLTAGPTDAPERHRSMRDAIDWSYRLLPDDQRALLRAMGAFAGTIPLDGIETVATAANIGSGGATIELIERLVDASILDTVDAGDGNPRFLLFATVREFVNREMELAGERAAMRDLHANWVDQLTSHYEPLALSDREHLVFGRMRLDLDNIRAALGWLLERGNIEQAARIAGNLWVVWAFDGQTSEGRRWIERIMPLLSTASLDPVDEWRFYYSAGMVAWAQGDAPLATARYQRALELAQTLDDRAKQGITLHWLSQSAWYESDYQRMIELAQETLRFGDDNPSAAAGAHDLLGIAAMRQGRLEDAERELAIALEQQSQQSLMRGVVWTLQLQADLSQQRGDIPAVARAHRQALPLALAAANHWAVFESLSGLLAGTLARGWIAEALELLASAELLMTSASVLPREGTWLSDADRARLKTGLQLDDLHRLAERAANLTLAQVVDRAVEIADSLASGKDAIPVDRPRQEAAPTDFALSRREQEVLALMVQGMSDRQIGDTLFISYGTARTHVYHVLQKLDARNRAMAVRKALEHELI